MCGLHDLNWQAPLPQSFLNNKIIRNGFLLNGFVTAGTAIQDARTTEDLRGFFRRGGIEAEPSAERGPTGGDWDKMKATGEVAIEILSSRGNPDDYPWRSEPKPDRASAVDCGE